MYLLALVNVAKHAQASRVVLRLESFPGRIRLSVADDGNGFDASQIVPPDAGSGWGLTIMRERAELIGANFRARSVPGQGATITVALSEQAR